MKRLTTALTLALILATPLKGGHPVKNPTVVMKTSMGSITIELDAAKAPETVKNFLAYVNAKHYDGTVFHRVIDGFMIQGGGLHGRQGAEEDERPDQERVRERPPEQGAARSPWRARAIRTAPPRSSSST